MSSHVALHLCKVSWKYLKRFQSYRANTILWQTETDRQPGQKQDVSQPCGGDIIIEVLVHMYVVLLNLLILLCLLYYIIVTVFVLSLSERHSKYTINWAISWDYGLFVLRKLILQTGMCSHPLGLDAWFLVGPFVYFHTSCVRTAKALARLPGYADSPEPSLVAYVRSTIISWAGSNSVEIWQRLHITLCSLSMAFCTKSQYNIDVFDINLKSYITCCNKPIKAWHSVICHDLFIKQLNIIFIQPSKFDSQIKYCPFLYFVGTIS